MAVTGIKPCFNRISSSFFLHIGRNLQLLWVVVISSAKSSSTCRTVESSHTKSVSLKEIECTTRVQSTFLRMFDLDWSRRQAYKLWNTYRHYPFFKRAQSVLYNLTLKRISFYNSQYIYLYESKENHVYRWLTCVACVEPRCQFKWSWETFHISVFNRLCSSCFLWLVDEILVMFSIVNHRNRSILEAFLKFDLCCCPARASLVAYATFARGGTNRSLADSERVLQEM